MPATLESKTIYQVVIDADYNKKVYYHLSFKGEEARYEFNNGPRIGFKQLLIHEEDLGWPLDNELFQKAEAQLGPCDVIFSHYLEVPPVTI
jgi:hypothetical protein